MLTGLYRSNGIAGRRGDPWRYRGNGRNGCHYHDQVHDPGDKLVDPDPRRIRRAPHRAPLTSYSRSMTYGKRFWKVAVERAVKTAGQLAAAAGVGLGTGVLDMGTWQAAGTAVAGGFALSILTSVASAPVGPDDSPSTV